MKLSNEIADITGRTSGIGLEAVKKRVWISGFSRLYPGYSASPTQKPSLPVPKEPVPAS
jgi:NAD(P)-dependent dehydrogenase (short-subunit alcohol dehydrogenase family)